MIKNKAEKLALIALGQNGTQSVKSRTARGEFDVSFKEAIKEVNPSSNVFYQNTEPVAEDASNGELFIGDLWMDSGNNYKIYVYDGTVWEAKPLGNTLDSSLITGTIVADIAITANTITGTLSADKISTGTLTSINISSSYISGSSALFNSATSTIADYSGHSWSCVSVNSTGAGLRGGSLGIGTNYGIVGDARTTNGFGVYGLCNYSSGRGVVGETNQSTGVGVYGNNTSTGYGGFFTNSGGNGDWSLKAEQGGANTTNYIARVDGSLSINSGISAGGGYIGNIAGGFCKSSYFNSGDGSGGGSGNLYGLTTGNYRAYIGGGVEPFTGQHIFFSSNAVKPDVGDIVYSSNAYVHDVSQAYAYVDKTTTQKDKRVVGIFNGKTETVKDFAIWSDDFGELVYDDIYTEDEEGNAIYCGPDVEGNYRQVQEEYEEFIDDLEAKGYYSLSINSLGEGAINVCNENGNIEIGDYICSSNVPGKGMKQDEEYLANYTVAKALEAVNWNEEESNIKMIACTYHCG